MDERNRRSSRAVGSRRTRGPSCARRRCASLGGFDIGYRITADYAAFLRLSLVADPVEVADVLAVFTEGGLSTVAWQESLGEFHRARREILHLSGWDGSRELLSTASLFGRMSLSRVVGAVRTGTR